MKRTALTAALLMGFYVAARAEVYSPEKLLPDDTLAVYTIPDFNLGTRETYQKSPHGQFWNDPSMKQFKDKFLEKLRSEYITPMEHQLSINLDDYTNLPQGQITLALTGAASLGKEGEDKEAAPILFLMDTKGSGSKLKSNLADLRKKWVDAGKSIKSEKIRDVDFSVVLLSHNELSKALKKSGSSTTNSESEPEPFENPELKNAPKKQIYIGQAESLLIMGNNSKAIEKILARMAGAEVKTLSDVPLYSACSSMFRDSEIYGWINTKTIIEAIIKKQEATPDSDSPSPLGGLKAPKIMAAMGITGLDSVSVSYNYSAEGSHVEMLLAVPEAKRSGIFKIFAGEQKDTTPPSFVPADAVKFQRWRIDGKKTYESIRKIVSDISPASLNGLDFAMGSAEGSAKEKDPSFDLKKDLFGNIGDDVVSYQKSPKGDSLASLNSAPAIYLIGSPDPARLMGAIRALMVLAPSAGGDSKDRDFLGHKIYSIPLPSANGEDKSMSYTTGGGYFVVATDNAILEEFLRSSEKPPKPLKEMTGLTEASSKVVSSESSLFGFSNESETMKVMFDLLKKDGSDPLAGIAPLAAAMGLNSVNLKDWVDLSLLPTYDKVSKYFNFTVYSFNANSSGLLLKGFSPVPPELKK